MPHGFIRGLGPQGRQSVQGRGAATPPRSHTHTRVHALSRPGVHTQHVTSSRVAPPCGPPPLTVCYPNISEQVSAATPRDTQKLSRHHMSRLLRESTYRPSRLCFSFLKWTCLRKSLLFFLPASPSGRKTSVFPILSLPLVPRPGVGKLPGCQTEGTPTDAWLLRGRPCKPGRENDTETQDVYSRPQACGKVPSLIWLSCWCDNLLFIYDLEFRSEMLSHGWVSTHSFQLEKMKPTF